MEKQNGLEIANYNWTSTKIWTLRGEILMSSRRHKYFQFVSWNKNSFWNEIAVVSLAEWKTLQNALLQETKTTVSSLEEDFFFSILVSKTDIHKANIMNQWWKILELPLGLYLLEVPHDTKWLAQVITGKEKEKKYFMAKTVERNLRVALPFTQAAL